MIPTKETEHKYPASRLLLMVDFRGHRLVRADEPARAAPPQRLHKMTIIYTSAAGTRLLRR